MNRSRSIHGFKQNATEMDDSSDSSDSSDEYYKNKIENMLKLVRNAKPRGNMFLTSPVQVPKLRRSVMMRAMEMPISSTPYTRPVKGFNENCTLSFSPINMLNNDIENTDIQAKATSIITISSEDQRTSSVHHNGHQTDDELAHDKISKSIPSKRKISKRLADKSKPDPADKSSVTLRRSKRNQSSTKKEVPSSSKHKHQRIIKKEKSHQGSSSSDDSDFVQDRELPENASMQKSRQEWATSKTQEKIANSSKGVSNITKERSMESNVKQISVKHDRSKHITDKSKSREKSPVLAKQKDSSSSSSDIESSDSESEDDVVPLRQHSTLTNKTRDKIDKTPSHDAVQKQSVKVMTPNSKLSCQAGQNNVLTPTGRRYTPSKQSEDSIENKNTNPVRELSNSIQPGTTTPLKGIATPDIIEELSKSSKPDSVSRIDKIFNIDKASETSLVSKSRQERPKSRQELSRSHKELSKSSKLETATPLKEIYDIVQELPKNSKSEIVSRLDKIFSNDKTSETSLLSKSHQERPKNRQELSKSRQELSKSHQELSESGESEAAIPLNKTVTNDIVHELSKNSKSDAVNRVDGIFNIDKTSETSSTSKSRQERPKSRQERPKSRHEQLESRQNLQLSNSRQELSKSTKPDSVCRMDTIFNIDNIGETSSTSKSSRKLTNHNSDVENKNEGRRRIDKLIERLSATKQKNESLIRKYEEVDKSCSPLPPKLPSSRKKARSWARSIRYSQPQYQEPDDEELTAGVEGGNVITDHVRKGSRVSRILTNSVIRERKNTTTKEIQTSQREKSTSISESEESAYLKACDDGLFGTLESDDSRLSNFSSKTDVFIGSLRTNSRRPWRLSDEIAQILPRRSTGRAGFLRGNDDIEDILTAEETLVGPGKRTNDNRTQSPFGCFSESGDSFYIHPKSVREAVSKQIAIIDYNDHENNSDNGVDNEEDNVFEDSMRSDVNSGVFTAALPKEARLSSKQSRIDQKTLRREKNADKKTLQENNAETLRKTSVPKKKRETYSRYTVGSRTSKSSEVVLETRGEGFQTESQVLSETPVRVDKSDVYQQNRKTNSIFEEGEAPETQGSRRQLFTTQEEMEELPQRIEDLPPKNSTDADVPTLMQRLLSLPKNEREQLLHLLQGDAPISTEDAVPPQIENNEDIPENREEILDNTNRQEEMHVSLTGEKKSSISSTASRDMSPVITGSGRRNKSILMKTLTSRLNEEDLARDERIPKMTDFTKELIVKCTSDLQIPQKINEDLPASQEIIEETVYPKTQEKDFATEDHNNTSESEIYSIDTKKQRKSHNKPSSESFRQSDRKGKSKSSRKSKSRSDSVLNCSSSSGKIHVIQHIQIAPQAQTDHDKSATDVNGSMRRHSENEPVEIPLETQDENKNQEENIKDRLGNLQPLEGIQSDDLNDEDHASFKRPRGRAKKTKYHQPSTSGMSSSSSVNASGDASSSTKDEEKLKKRPVKTKTTKKSTSILATPSTSSCLTESSTESGLRRSGRERRTIQREITYILCGEESSYREYSKGSFITTPDEKVVKEIEKKINSSAKKSTVTQKRRTHKTLPPIEESAERIAEETDDHEPPKKTSKSSSKEERAVRRNLQMEFPSCIHSNSTTSNVNTDNDVQIGQDSEADNDVTLTNDQHIGEHSTADGKESGRKNTDEVLSGKIKKKSTKKSDVSGKISKVISNTRRSSRATSSAHKESSTESSNKRKGPRRRPSFTKDELKESDVADILLNDKLVTVKLFNCNPAYESFDNIYISEFLTLHNGVEMCSMKIPAGGRKPFRCSQNTLAYYVASGNGIFQLRSNICYVSQGSQVFVPVGMEYSIANTTEEELVLCCVNCTEQRTLDIKNR